MSTSIFVNLPVKDLAKSVDFFTQLGFAFDARMTDAKATCMVVNELASVMLLVEEFFTTFTDKKVCDSVTHTEVILCISTETRSGVDELVKKALAAGGSASHFSMDEGPMYGRSFQDLDGHLWEVMHMDPSALPQ